jgi:hypothetical protein
VHHEAAAQQLAAAGAGVWASWWAVLARSLAVLLNFVAVWLAGVLWLQADCCYERAAGISKLECLRRAIARSKGATWNLGLLWHMGRLLQQQ